MNLNSNNLGQYIESNSDLNDKYKHFLRANMMIYEDRNLCHERFNRVQFSNPYYALGPTREYIFFTKPDLNIMKNQNDLNNAISGNPFWTEMKRYYRRVISDLQQSASRSGVEGDRHVFIPLLTNMVSSNLDLPSKDSTSADTPSNIYGTNLTYRKGSLSSDENINFSLEFHDSPWLDVYHFFKMWDSYETLKDMGMIEPPTSINGYNTRENKILHDQIAVYKFIVDDDMSTIIHYSKIYGAYPTSVPRESFSSLKEGLIEYSVSWSGQFVQDQDPWILYEFNLAAQHFLGGTLSNTGSIKQLFNTSYNEIDGSFCKCPYVIAVSDSSRPTGMRYKLVWLDHL